MPPIWASKQDYVTLLWQIVSRGWALPCIPGLAAAALPRNIYVMLASAVNRISYCNLEMIYFTLKLNCDVIFVCTIHLHFNSIMNVKFTLEFIYLIHFTYQQCSEGHFLKGKDILLSTLYESYLKVICEVTLNIFTRLYHCVVVWRKILDLQSCLQSWFIFCRHDKTKESTPHERVIIHLFSCVASVMTKCTGGRGCLLVHPGLTCYKWHDNMTSD